jgi:hypothetical protein
MSKPSFTADASLYRTESFYAARGGLQAGLSGSGHNTHSDRAELPQDLRR